MSLSPVRPSSPAGRRIVTMLGERGPMTRAQLARVTGLPKSSVSAAVAELGDAGVVVETGAATTLPGGRGRPGTTLSLDPALGHCVGLDFGYRHVRGVVVDAAHTILGRHEVEVPRLYDAAAAVDAAAEVTAAALDAAGASPDRVLGVGAGIPLGMQRASPAQLGMRQGWDGTDVPSALAERLGHVPAIDNDANCAALAEMVWGAGRDYSDIVFFKVHSGVGGALVLDRAVRRGGSGAAAEFGHMCLDPAGPLCRCGGKGCLETYASVHAVFRVLEPLTGDDLTLQDVFDAAAAGQPAYRRALMDAAHAVGRAAGMLCNAINPEVVIVGGALARAGDLMLDEVRRTLRQSCLMLNAEVDVVAATTGRDAGALGAAALALRERALR